MDLAECFRGIVHEPTQATDAGFDLTVDTVHEVTSPGRIDFGGGELEPATTDPVATERRHPDDDYGWWSLDAGRYLLEYNESVADDSRRYRVQPREALLERGASHATVTVASLPRMPLAVGGAGLHLKENARVSTVVSSTPA